MRYSVSVVVAALMLLGSVNAGFAQVIEEPPDSPGRKDRGITVEEAKEFLVVAEDALEANVSGQQVALSSMLRTATAPTAVQLLELALDKKLACEAGLESFIGNLEEVIDGTGFHDLSSARYTFHLSLAINKTTRSLIDSLSRNPTLADQASDEDISFFTFQNDLQAAALAEGLAILRPTDKVVISK